MGGLSRRATVIASQKAEAGDAPVFVVDGGDWAWTSASVAESRLPQQRAKGELIAASFAVAGIDAMVPGETDLALGLTWLMGQVRRNNLPMLAANLTCHGSAPFPASTVIDRGGVRLGIVGVVDPSVGAGKADDCIATDANDAVSRAIGRMRADVVLVLSHQTSDQDRVLSAAVPGIDLLLNGHDRINNTTPRVFPGGALQLGSGSRGKRVGVATLTLVPGGSGFEAIDERQSVSRKLDRVRTRLSEAEARSERAREKAATMPDDEDLAVAVTRAEKQRSYYAEQVGILEAELVSATVVVPSAQHRLTNRNVDLDDTIADDPATVALIDAAKPLIGAAGLDAAEARRDASPFVGSVSCRNCHTLAWAQWQESAHSHAWNTLEKERRQNDLDCWSCHATGAFHEGGPDQPGNVGNLTDVGCEACHGPGERHMADPVASGTLVGDPPAAVCMRCHDGVQDEGRFDFDTYRPKVVHVDDPR